MHKMKLSLGVLFCVAALGACSSTPSVTEIPNTSDPTAEINRVEGNINQARVDFVDVLSPTNFQSAASALDEAKKAREKNKDVKTILHDVALSQTYLDRASSIAKVATQTMPTVVAERKDALAADAPRYFGKEFAELDNDLKDVTKDVENNSTSSAEKNRGQLTTRYSDLELHSIRQAKIGEAQTNYDLAVKEGAKKLVPQTMATTSRQLNASDAVIRADRHNTAAVDKASTDARAAAARLLALVRTAKNSAQENPEQLALQSEAKQQSLDQTKQVLAQTTAEVGDKNRDLTVLASENEKLESKGKVEKEYEAAKAEFASDEAEVYKQGDKILLRLKGLSFPKDQAVITSNNFALLAKVQKVIKDAGESTVAVEGHTDSRGSKTINEKISTARAEAVQDYLKANNTVAENKISAKGFGDSRPIASNKTPTGRAQNRRVDVIITSDTSAQ